MKIIFLGSGSAFTVGENNYHSNIIIIADDNKKLLLDCGGDIRHSLFEQGLSHTDIEAVYISHLHSDHVGGLEWLGFSKKFIDRSIPELYISDDQVDNLWNNVLSGGMSCIANHPTTLNSFFKVNKIKENEKFVWGGLEFKLIKTLHIRNNQTYLPCYGLFINYQDHKIFITTDTIFDPIRLEKYYNSAELIFQDCETSSIHTHVHAHFDQLKKLPFEIKRKTWLYDYNPGPLPNVQEQGFLGFVKKGQVFNF